MLNHAQRFGRFKAILLPSFYCHQNERLGGSYSLFYTRDAWRSGTLDKSLILNIYACGAAEWLCGAVRRLRRAQLRRYGATPPLWSATPPLLSAKLRRCGAVPRRWRAIPRLCGATPRRCGALPPLGGAVRRLRRATRPLCAIFGVGSRNGGGFRDTERRACGAAASNHSDHWRGDDCHKQNRLFVPGCFFGLNVLAGFAACARVNEPNQTASNTFFQTCPPESSDSMRVGP
jgi:hypothetical protein